MLTKEMQRALEADGEKLRQLTGEDHGPYFIEGNRDMTSTGAYPPGCTQADVDRAAEGDEPLDPPTAEETEGEAWEYWHGRAIAAEAEAFRLRAALREYLDADDEVQRTVGGDRDDHDRALNRLIAAQKAAHAIIRAENAGS